MTMHDGSYKHIFSHAPIVEDLLRGFVHEDWVSQIDYGSLEKVSGSYVTDDLREREDDIIWRVRLEDDWLYVCLLRPGRGLTRQSAQRGSKKAPGGAINPLKLGGTRIPVYDSS
ncbi:MULTISPECIES: Rpn family recombination-promoting nuclease/putative transposase [Methylococcus]|uniref:Rpn family recombination-promoting nuclease/putative transposase n=1 Tax=Methylococcus capsulatus TaxID=414 RepID=A0ABZ2F3N1_METCP|nr:MULTISPECIES: Rpn family recombination-promoting nuclease/putative transposase [Methylococcus]MDF9392789.1 hypothetical protein [Methylococcus capsulatus]